TTGAGPACSGRAATSTEERQGGSEQGEAGEQAEPAPSFQHRRPIRVARRHAGKANAAGQASEAGHRADHPPGRLLWWKGWMPYTCTL
ncbi:hypothetical protein, partial [Escherichia coli]|uniref:hypothetical protein n=1 Tax=Escherichia coli TaxID=562 RepID=UPI001A7F075A